MYRGEIWWANLPEPVGSEPGYNRPVLVIQVSTCPCYSRRELKNTCNRLSAARSLFRLLSDSYSL